MTDAASPSTPETGRTFELPAGYDGLAEARRLLRSIRAGALGTLDPEGGPFTSLVNVATDTDGSPLLLMSQLSAHTRHLAADGRVSLLLAEVGKGDPLAHPRLTLTG
ncbi:MAG: pyridoxamine 5-phosphate oxidase, partial [Hyphomicrobiales bacterium]|nr:pyridoxamine 5-phosphate oxidase [Hyphomicrobiales bacterium]